MLADQNQVKAAGDEAVNRVLLLKEVDLDATVAQAARQRARFVFIGLTIAVSSVQVAWLGSSSTLPDAVLTHTLSVVRPPHLFRDRVCFGTRR